MDALLKAAIESLLKKILPELQVELQNVYDDKLPDQSAKPNLNTISECQELLEIVKNTLSSDQASAGPTKQATDLSDEQAYQLLLEMDGQAEPESKHSVAAEQGLGQSMEDEEAMRLLAEMDGPVEPEIEHRAAAEQGLGQSMEDDEAMRLLAEMDSPSAVSESEPNPKKSNIAPQAAIKEEAVEEASNEKTSASHDRELEAEWEINDFQTDPDMINDFIVNSDEVMVSLDQAILQLEQDPSNSEIIEEIFRGAHTLKGAAGMFGFRALERVMHAMESLFDLIRKGKLAPDADIVDVVFAGLDVLRELLNAVKAGKP